MAQRARLAWLLLLGACTPTANPAKPSPGDAASTSSRSASAAPVVPSTAEPPPSKPDRSCAALTRTACMQSTECTLDQETPRSRQYRCRPSTSPCELGFAQAGFWGSGSDGVARSRAQQAECAARPGCAFVDGSCYCHCRGMGQTAVPDGDEAEACECECSGGPPPNCGIRP